MADNADEGKASQVAKGHHIAQASDHSMATLIENTYENVFPRPVEQAVIAVAIQKLSTLPLARLPAVSALPPASRLPAFARNPSFVGREAELAHLAGVLKARDLATVVVTGLGGVGKSQLASEFVYRYGQYFAGGIFWLSFASAEAVRAEVAVCTLALGQELRLDVRTLPVDEQVQLVLSCWQNSLPRLLVFDNCEDEALLARWRPRIGGCRMLITSRRGVWHPDLGISLVPLDIFPREKSVELLGTYRSDLSVFDREQIAQELGDLPLALSMAGSYLHTYRESRLGDPKQYLHALRQKSPLEHTSLQQEGATYTTGHTEHVARTFALSYEQLNLEEPIDATALQVLAHVSCFAPGEPIPRDLLRLTMGPEEDDEEEDRFVKALKQVYTLGLLTRQREGALQMHRLLVTFVQQRLTSTRAATEAQTAVEEVVLHRADEVNEGGYPAPLLLLQEHLRVVTARAREREDAMAVDLHAAFGRHLFMIGAYQEAQGYTEWALLIREQSLGPEHPDVAITLTNLAILYKDQGKNAEAEQLYLRALRITEQSQGSDHPQMAFSLHGLANLYSDQGKNAEAEQLYLRALHIREQCLGPEHPDLAFSLTGLANLYSDQGKYTKAEQLYLRALHIWEQRRGSEHPHVASPLINLANLYKKQDKYAEAEQLYLRALHIWEQSLGPEHPHVASPLTGLAILYKDQGKNAEAEQFYLRALHIREQSLGPDHPDLAFSLTNLALLYWQQGKNAEAEPLYLRALHIREQSQGLDHPDVASPLNGLALLYWQQGKNAEAEPLYLRVVQIREQSLGPEHPDTAAALANLANIYEVQGKNAEAEPLYLRALRITEQSQGLDHPDVAFPLTNLANIYEVQGKNAEAEPLYLRALRITEQSQGPDHPEAAAALYKLTILYCKQEKYTEAKPLFQRVVQIREKNLGLDHPHVAAALYGLALLYKKQGKNAEAEPLYLRALRITEQSQGPDHPEAAAALNTLADLYEERGKHAEAKKREEGP